MPATLVRLPPRAAQNNGVWLLAVLADSDLIKNNNWLPHRVVAGGKRVYVVGHILEGLALAAGRDDGSLGASLAGHRTGNRLGAWRLTVDAVERILAAAEAGGVFKKPSGALEVVMDAMTAFGAAPNSLAACSVRFADLESTAGCDVLGAVDSGVYKANHIPFLLDDEHSCMRITGEMVLLFGSRYTNAARQAVGGSFIMMGETVLEAVMSRHPHAVLIARAARLVKSELQRIYGASSVRLSAIAPVVEYETFSAMLAFANGSAEVKEQWLGLYSGRFLFRFPWLSKVAAAAGVPPAELPSVVRRIADGRIKSKGHSAEALFRLVEAELKASKTLVKYALKHHKGEELIAKVTESRDLGAIHRSSDSTGGDGDSEKVLKGKLVLSIEAQRRLKESTSFLVAAGKVHALLRKPLTERVLNQIFAILSGPGLLVCWQTLLKHPQLRGFHAFLNDVHQLKDHICTRVGYCLVAGASGKRKGFADTFKWSKTQHEIFLSGEHERLLVYTQGLLLARKAQRNATEVDPEVEEPDWLHDAAHFQAMIDTWHRLTLAYGYAATPSVGTSAREWLELLGDYRALIDEAAEDEQPRMYGFMWEWYVEGLTEAGTYFVEMMNSIDPAERRLEGYLPPSSSTAGVVKKVKVALRAQRKVDKFRLHAPQLFPERNLIVRGAKVGAKKRKRDDADPQPLKDDDQATQQVKVGSLSQLVEVIDADYFKIKDYTYGPISRLAKECGVEPKDRCWPVMASTKAMPRRCELCPSPASKGHDKRLSGAHKMVKLPKGYKGWFKRLSKDFVVPAPSGGAASAQSA